MGYFLILMWFSLSYHQSSLLPKKCVAFLFLPTDRVPSPYIRPRCSASRTKKTLSFDLPQTPHDGKTQPPASPPLDRSIRPDRGPIPILLSRHGGRWTAATTLLLSCRRRPPARSPPPSPPIPAKAPLLLCRLLSPSKPDHGNGALSCVPRWGLGRRDHNPVGISPRTRPLGWVLPPLRMGSKGGTTSSSRSARQRPIGSPVVNMGVRPHGGGGRGDWMWSNPTCRWWRLAVHVILSSPGIPIPCLPLQKRA